MTKENSPGIFFSYHIRVIWSTLFFHQTFFFYLVHRLFFEEVNLRRLVFTPFLRIIIYLFFAKIQDRDLSLEYPCTHYHTLQLTDQLGGHCPTPLVSFKNIWNHKMTHRNVASNKSAINQVTRIECAPHAVQMCVYFYFECYYLS